MVNIPGKFSSTLPVIVKRINNTIYYTSDNGIYSLFIPILLTRIDDSQKIDLTLFDDK